MVRPPTPGEAALAGLAAGRLSGWSGVPDGSSREDVEQAFGPSEPGQDGPVLLEGDPLGFRDYPPLTPFAPHGVTVWYSGESLVALRVVQPSLAHAEVDSLGPPELREPSGVAPYHEESAWPGRGLSLHRGVGSGVVLHLYAYRATGLEPYRRSWLAHIVYRRVERHG